MYGTGIRGRSALSGVTAGIGGIDCQVVYAGPHCCYIGVDQVSIRLPRVLAGRGDVDVQVSVDGKPVNTVKINFLK